MNQSINKRIGVLGGGQLGRMMIQAAADHNLLIHIMDPDPRCPCVNTAASFTKGDLTDRHAVYAFGKDKDLLTIEIENVNIEALKRLEDEGVTVYPQPHVIELIQDKRKQKEFYTQHNIPTAPYVLIDNPQQISEHQDFLPAFYKQGKEGYDGRGVQRLREGEKLPEHFTKPGLLEKLVKVEKELAVQVAVNKKGEMVCFPAVEMVFHPQHNLVEYLLCPADITKEQAAEAERLAREVTKAIGIVGLLSVELFLDKSGNILVNEIAPRPHNSGHHTIEGNMLSQFNLHLRAILNQPLLTPEVRIPSGMVNLLGEPGHSGPAKYLKLNEVLAIPGTYIHLYGKTETRPYRKMGHVTVTDHDRKRLQEKLRFVRENLKIVS